MKHPKFTKVINLSNNIKHICKQSNALLNKLANKQRAYDAGKKVRVVDVKGNKVWPKQYTQRMG